MGQGWKTPSYVYDGQTTLASLLATFMQENGNPDLKKIAKAMNTSPDLVARWQSGEWTQGLITKNRADFEGTTGIELDRLMVIRTKQEILESLKRVEDIRRENPSLAWLLSKDPRLAEKIDFQSLPTRQEIVLEISDLYVQIGGGIVALQLGLDNTVINAWTRGVHLPTDEALMRVIILQTIGFVRGSPGEETSRDDVRFRVLCERILGTDPRPILGVANFKEAVDRIFDDLKGRAISVVENRTGMTRQPIVRLQGWRYPGNGCTNSDTIIQMIRLLFRERHPDKMDAFELAASELKEGKGKLRVEHPVFWHEVTAHEKGEVHLVVTKAVTDKPAIEHDPYATPEPVAEQPPLTQTVCEPALSTRVPDMISITFMGALATMSEILRLYPELKVRLPRELLAQPPVPDPVKELTPVRTCPDVATRNVRWTEQEVSERILELVQIMQDVCSWSPEARDRVLTAVDDPLTAIGDLLLALKLKEPSKFLDRHIRPQQEAAALVPKTKQRR